jgi:amino acid adenylation domain-containing protein
MSDLTQRITKLSPEQRRALETELLQASPAAPGRQAIPRRALTDRCPLSFAQQRLWFLEQLEPNSPRYHIRAGFRLEGRLDVAALQAALATIVARHAVLRTTFASVEGEPVQVILPARPVELAVRDLRHQPPHERQAMAERLLSEAVRRPFNLTQDLLLRATLVQLADSEQLLLLVIHHIAADGWSLAILLQELSACYEAHLAGKPCALPALPLQYADFAVWQRGWLQGEVLKSPLAYWTEQLRGAPPVLELPTDRPRPALQAFTGASQRVLLPRALAEALQALSRQEGATLFMTLLAAFTTLLWRYSGQEDIVVGSPIAGRNRTEIEGLIGLFVNTLALRTDLSGNPTFRALLARVRALTLAAYTHQDLPFEKLVEALQPERSLRHSPLFQVLLVLQNTAPAALRLDGLRVHRLAVTSGTAKFDLTLYLTERADGLLTSLEYSTELFDAATIERLLGHYRVLLEGVVTDPDQRLADLPLLTEAERQQLLVDWNATPTDAVPVACAHELFEAQVEQTPNAVAVCFAERRLSYRELDRQANQLAHYLRSLGVGPDTLVAVGVERSIELVVAVLGIWKAGGAYVALDPAYPEERLQFLLKDSQAPVLVTTAALVPRLAAPCARAVCLDADAPQIARQPDRRPEQRAGPDNLAYVLYTSGSTGRPKGVAVVHRGPAALLNWTLRTFTGEQLAGMLFSTSICFDLSVFELLAPLSCGGKVIVIPDALHLPECAAAGEVTFLNTVPSVMAELLRRPGLPTAVQVIALAGEPLSARLVQQCYQLPGVEHVFNLYGPTEATVYATFCRVLEDQDGPPPIGRPISGTRAYVLDEHLQPVPIGMPGELYLGGAGLARGYLNRPELTGARFLPDPFSAQPSARLYRTGDRCRYRADGNLEFLGRLDNQVKVRGFRIELGEIEAVLNEHPQVQETAVLLHQNAAGDQQLVAYVMPHGPAPALADLRGFVQQKLPGYMVPAAFVLLERLPLSPTGKVDRRALPALNGACLAGEQTYTAPRTRVEKMLAEIWASVLGLEQVGVGDHFFEAGGHSLLAMRVLARVQQAFSVELPLRQLFETPRLADLARAIDAVRSTSPEPPRPIQPAARTDDLRLSFAQQRLWFLDRWQPGSSLYHIPTLMRLRGRLDVMALERSFEEIVRRHEAFQTTFPAVNGQPVQLIASVQRPEINIVDFREVADAERETTARRAAAEEIAKPFDLARGPLLRIRLLRLADEEHLLLLVLHHIISDGWSFRILARELALLYEAFTREGSSPLANLPVQYSDFAVWQRRWLQGDVLQRQLAYWKEHLRGAPSELALPTDHARPTHYPHRGAALRCTLPRATAEAIGALSRQEDATPFMTLLTAFAALLQRCTGQEDIVIGSPIAGRSRPETEPIVGFFVNTLPLRFDLSGRPTFRELLRRARAVALGGYTHQDVPFERLVEELQPPRDPGRTPLFQVLFAFQADAVPWQLPGLKVEPAAVESTTAKFDLTLFASEREDGLTLALEYSAELFEAATAGRLLGHYRTLLEGALAEPDQLVARLPVLTSAQRQQILVAWNDRKAPLRDVCVHELFEAQAKRTPEATAVVFGDRQLRYRELNERANQLAHHLRALGVGPEVRVGLCLERSLEMIVGLLGILKAGGASVPLDPTDPADRLAFLLHDTQTPLLLTQTQLRARLPDTQARLLCLDAEAALLAQQDCSNPVSGARPENLFAIHYTSGSTGQPNGVQVVHRGVIRLLCGVDYVRLDATQTLLHHSPLAFDASTFEIWGALLHGARCVLFPERIPSVEPLGRLLAEQRVSVLWLTSALFNAIVDEAPEILRGVRQLLVGGEALSLGHVRRALEQLPETELCNGYGPTEGTTFSCCYLIPRDLDARVASVPIGRPLANTQVYVLDAELQPVPVGVPGELYLSGAGLARGYLNRPERTAERFIPHPFVQERETRLYRTGDRVRWLPDGNLEFLGRLDQQVKLRGFRVELGEVEAVLAQHPAVAQAVATVREARPGDRWLVAYVVGKAGAKPEPQALREFLRQQLPEYMIPAAFLVLDAIPLTSNGKIDRRSLPPPDWGGAEQEQTRAEPRNDIERRLAAIWAELLQRERVGVQDNFFDLGGHSLLAIQLFARIEKSFGQSLPLATLFQGGTIERLAALLDEQSRPRIPKQVVALQPLGSRPPLFLLPSLFTDLIHYQELVQHLDPDQPVYGLLPCAADGSVPAYTRLEDMAATIERGLRAFWPEGPYRLAGYSFGGPLAYELAQQLSAAGQQVSLLALIDTGLLRPLPPSVLDVLRAVPGMLGNLPFWVMDDLFQSSPSQLLARLGKRTRTKWRKLRGILGRAAPSAKETVLDEMFEMERFTDDFQRRLEMNYHAWSSYEPRAYAGWVALFRARTRSLWHVAGRQPGWGRLPAGGVAIRIVPGQHESILKEPHVRVLAGRLQEALDECGGHTT